MACCYEMRHLSLSFFPFHKITKILVISLIYAVDTYGQEQGIPTIARFTECPYFVSYRHQIALYHIKLYCI